MTEVEIDEWYRAGILGPNDEIGDSFRGLPQGLATSPILFSFYISSLLNRLERTTGLVFTVYGDDMFFLMLPDTDPVWLLAEIQAALSKTGPKGFRLKLSKKKAARVILATESFTALGIQFTDFISPGNGEDKNFANTYFINVLKCIAAKAADGGEPCNEKLRDFALRLLPKTTWFAQHEWPQWINYAKKMPYRTETREEFDRVWNNSRADYHRVNDDLTNATPMLSEHMMRQHTESPNRDTLDTHPLIMNFHTRRAVGDAWRDHLLKDGDNSDRFGEFPGWHETDLLWGLVSSQNVLQRQLRSGLQEKLTADKSWGPVLKQYHYSVSLITNFATEQRTVGLGKLSSVIDELWATMVAFAPIDTLTMVSHDYPKKPNGSGILSLTDDERDFATKLLFNELRFINRLYQHSSGIPDRKIQRLLRGKCICRYLYLVSNGKQRFDSYLQWQFGRITFGAFHLQNELLDLARKYKNQKIKDHETFDQAVSELIDRYQRMNN